MPERVHVRLFLKEKKISLGIIICLPTKETEEFLYTMVAKQESHRDEKNH